MANSAAVLLARYTEKIATRSLTPCLVGKNPPRHGRTADQKIMVSHVFGTYVTFLDMIYRLSNIKQIYLSVVGS
jgi:hypothetical protein